MTGTLYYDQVKKKPVIKSGNQTLHLDNGDMIEVLSILPSMVNQGNWDAVTIKHEDITKLPYGNVARTI